MVAFNQLAVSAWCLLNYSYKTYKDNFKAKMVLFEMMKMIQINYIF